MLIHENIRGPATSLTRGDPMLVQPTVAAEAGAIGKTSGYAVMATFPTPDRALGAAHARGDA